ncbi:MAG TPA: hypothetical protein VIC08_16610 [Cellvibrionaceae bacterium]
MYTLIFTGELITGFRRDAVITNVAALIQEPEAVVRRDMFGVDKVVIKRVDDWGDALNWRQAFAGAGAVLVVLDDDGKGAPVGLQISVEEPSFLSEMARIPGIRARNLAFVYLALAVFVAIAVSVLLMLLVKAVF